MLLAGAGVAMVLMDLRNQDRFLMVCRSDSMEIHQARRLPWPFGHERVGGVGFRPVRIPSGTDCRQQVFQSRKDAVSGLLDYLLIQVRSALAQPGKSNLVEARRQVLQAQQLARTRQTMLVEIRKLRAELSYRQARSGLARVEDELRTALNRFREARKLGGKRFSDLDEWIEHLQELLQGITPAPRKKAKPVAEVPAPVIPAPVIPPPPLPRIPDAGVKPGPVPLSPDAGPPEEGSGVLM